MSPDSDDIIVCALYHFTRIDDCERLRGALLALLRDEGVRGTLLIAGEGINGTVAGSRSGIDRLRCYLSGDGRFGGIRFRESRAMAMPFLHTRVKIKKEIVTLGLSDANPARAAGAYVKPADWNALIADPAVTLIDTRNDYEVRVGSFRGALNPRTETFREFPDYVRRNLDPGGIQKAALFCTGGIRCEKATALLKSRGFEEVYHLEGGILKYLEEIPVEDSLWEGECFVFDDRVTVNHHLQPGSYDQCRACRMPVSEADKRNDAWVEGVSCLHCIDRKTDEDRARFRERQRQIELARERGEDHIGAAAATAQARSRQKKAARQRHWRTG